jgi:PPOX class probable FMN-dependent enzyme
MPSSCLIETEINPGKSKAISMHKINSSEALEQVYSGEVGERSLWKEIDHVNDLYRKFIEASPFLILSSYGDSGVDCSPRGDPPGFVRVASPECIQIPDRKGNNRLDSMRNILQNPSVGVIFLIPNVGETLRISGRAEILADAELCESFAINGRPASSVISIQVDKVYYQCQKALVRSRLWNSQTHVERGDVPTAGQMAKHFSARNGVDFDGDSYDAGYTEHMKKTIY